MLMRFPQWSRYCFRSRSWNTGPGFLLYSASLFPTGWKNSYEITNTLSCLLDDYISGVPLGQSSLGKSDSIDRLSPAGLLSSSPNTHHRNCFCQLSITFYYQIKCSKFTPADAAAAKSLQSCPTLCDPIDGSPPVFLVPGILQARTLEWVAIPFPMHESEK